MQWLNKGKDSKMTQAYSDPKRKNDPYALPDIEIFWLDVGSGTRDDNGTPLPQGWYYWFCFPGCLPDSDPIGPFETEAAALADAQVQHDGE
jgi:hypothetical protein